MLAASSALIRLLGDPTLQRLRNIGGADSNSSLLHGKLLETESGTKENTGCGGIHGR